MAIHAVMKTISPQTILGTEKPQGAKGQGIAPKIFKAADLFCGLGGTSEGLRRAVLGTQSDLELVAVNHWPIAISSHQANHPYAKHFNADIHKLDPLELVPGGELDLLVASPECIHFSTARGGRPMCDQSRATARDILRWAKRIRIRSILIENVKEFAGWGPLDPATNRPIMAEKGRYFLNFIEGFRRLGYTVEWRNLNAADYGDATTRVRLFIRARADGKRIWWPEATHCDPKKLVAAKGMNPELEPWFTARNKVIDWKVPSQSIFKRKKPLAEKTLRRIEAGLRKFNGPNAEPFLIMLRNHMGARSLDEPIPTITGGGNHVGLVEPFLIGAGGPSGSARPDSINDPLGTVMTENHRAVVEPFILPHPHPKGDAPTSIDNPLQTVTASSSDMALVEPFILPHRMFDRMDVDTVEAPLRTIVGQNGRGNKLVQPVLIKYHGGEKQAQWERSQSVDLPLQTQDTSNRFAVVEPMIVNTPFLVPHYGEREDQQPRTHSVDDPLPTVTTSPKVLVEPFMVDVTHTDKTIKAEGSRARSIDQPLGTITGAKRGEKAVVEPFLVEAAHGQDPGVSKAKSAKRRAKSINEPLPTVTGSNGQALCEPFVVQYNGTSDARSVDEPLATVPTKDRFALVELWVRQADDSILQAEYPFALIDDQNRIRFFLDIKLRMLRPHELAAAMSLEGEDGKPYEIKGTLEQQVKQIGNAVPRKMAQALISALLKEEEDDDIIPPEVAA